MTTRQVREKCVKDERRYWQHLSAIQTESCADCYCPPSFIKTCKIENCKKVRPHECVADYVEEKPLHNLKPTRNYFAWSLLAA